MRRFWRQPVAEAFEPTVVVFPDDPEAILLFGIEEIAMKEMKGPNMIGIMSAIGAHEFANEVLVAYWKAKALKNG